MSLIKSLMTPCGVNIAIRYFIVIETDTPMYLHLTFSFIYRELLQDVTCDDHWGSSKFISGCLSAET